MSQEHCLFITIYFKGAFGWNDLDLKEEGLWEGFELCLTLGMNLISIPVTHVIITTKVLGGTSNPFNIEMIQTSVKNL